MTIQLQVGWAGIKVKIKELKKHFYYLKCFRQWVGEPEWLLRTHTENRQKMLQIKRLTKTFFQKKYRIVTHQMWSILQETCAPLFLSFHFAGYNTNSTPTNKQKRKIPEDKTLSMSQGGGVAMREMLPLCAPHHPQQHNHSMGSGKQQQMRLDIWTVACYNRTTIIQPCKHPAASWKAIKISTEHFTYAENPFQISKLEISFLFRFTRHHLAVLPGSKLHKAKIPKSCVSL